MDKIFKIVIETTVRPEKFDDPYPGYRAPTKRYYINEREVTELEYHAEIDTERKKLLPSDT